MTVRMLSTTALVAALSIAPMGAAFAQDAALRGEITQIFDGRVLLQTDDGAILVQLPEDVDGDSLEPGQRFAVEGDRTGSDMVATAMRLQSESAARRTCSDGSQASDTPDLPDALAGLDLRDLRIERDDDETKYRARLDGMKFEAEYDPTAGWRRSRPSAPHPARSAGGAAAVGGSARARSRISGFVRLTRSSARPTRSRSRGTMPRTRRMEAEFAPSGLLLEFERKDHGSENAKARRCSLATTRCAILPTTRAIPISAG